MFNKVHRLRDGSSEDPLDKSTSSAILDHDRGYLIGDFGRSVIPEYNYCRSHELRCHLAITQSCLLLHESATCSRHNHKRTTVVPTIDVSWMSSVQRMMSTIGALTL